MKEIEKFKVSYADNIRTAIKKMDNGGIGFIYIVDYSENIIGIVTNGDFRRAILNGVSLDENVVKIANKAFKYLPPDFKENDVALLFKNTVVQHIPIVENSKVIDIITEESYYGIKHESSYRKIDIPVVIMAGGKGTRLHPFTNVLPKPLIPLGDKTILEILINEFRNYAIEQFYITLNYKGGIIKAYLDSIEKAYKVNYIFEKEFLGTAGSLAFLKTEINETFFVSNCDILVRADYADVYDYHKKQKACLTILSSLQHYTIPYGIIKYKNGGEVISILEKPEQSIPINTGVYLLEKEAISYIPENNFFHMTDLIEKLIHHDKKVVMYPINQSDYIDIGQLDDYKNTVNKLAIP